MTIAHLLTGVIFLIIGIVLDYYLLPLPQKTTQKQKVNTKFLLDSTGSLFRSMMGFIFIFLGIMSILTFCFGIDGGYYTPQKEDDMTILNGITIVICTFSLERNIVYYLQKFKNYRKNIHVLKKSVIYLSLLLIVFSCKKDDYIAEFSYSVNGKRFTAKGGGISWEEWFVGDRVDHVYHRTILYAPLKKNEGEKYMMDQTLSYDFCISDYTGGGKRHFDMQAPKEVYPFFTLNYKGKHYKAISGSIDIVRKEKNGFQGVFEAVMVAPIFYPTDTIIVKNGLFYYSAVSYSHGIKE